MKFLTTIVPSLFIGALLFGSVVGRADDGRTPPTPPTPPTALPTPPKPPKPPRVHAAGGSGFNIAIHDGKVTIDGLDAMVDEQINNALRQVSGNTQIPAPIREKLTKRLEKVRAKVKARLSHIDAKDIDQVGEELDKLGDEIGDEMDQFGQDMDQFGSDMDKFGKDMDKWGKDFGKQFGKNFARNWNMQGSNIGTTDDDDADDDSDADADDDVDVDAVRDLGDLALSQPQRDTLKKLRADSDAKVAAAKQALDKASDALEKQLQNPTASDADISRSIDAVAQQEAAIRKARILAWVNARRLLDDDQRKKVEGATKHKTR